MANYYFVGVLCFLAAIARGQAPSATNPPADPLMTLMLAQPKIEFGSAVTAVSWFDPPMIQPGQICYYRVAFNALEESIEWPEAISAPPQLELRQGARGQFLQPTGATTEPRTTFSYRVRVTQPGEITVPAFKVQAYGKAITVPAARLQVVSSANAAIPTAQQLILEIGNTNLFVGQPINVRILLPSATPGLVQVLAQAQLIGQGFIVDQGAVRQRAENNMRGGINFVTFLHETMLIPVAAGKLGLFAQAFTISPRWQNAPPTNSPFNLAVGGQQFILIESDPTELNVQPLPKQGELPGFTGAIGLFSLDPPKLATNTVHVGDPVKLSVTVHAASFARLVAPPAPRSKDWQVLSATLEGEPAQMLQARGLATFDYTLIPMSIESKATPPIPFSCFDPNRGVYVDLSIPSVSVTVLPGRAPADLVTASHSEANPSQGEEELTLSGLAAAPGRGAATLLPLERQAWFRFMQLAPVAGFLGLAAWDRRRRYLETHPQILLRRRARRALRRERRIIRRAALGGDVTSFGAAAVRALRIGSAPHFPAKPGALVGSDVVHLLDQHELSPGSGATAVVRRFFATDDASKFSTGSLSARDLLGLQPQLEQVLERLEAEL